MLNHPGTTIEIEREKETTRYAKMYELSKKVLTTKKATWGYIITVHLTDGEGNKTGETVTFKTCRGKNYDGQTWFAQHVGSFDENAINDSAYEAYSLKNLKSMIADDIDCLKSEFGADGTLIASPIANEEKELNTIVKFNNGLTEIEREIESIVQIREIKKWVKKGFKVAVVQEGKLLKEVNEVLIKKDAKLRPEIYLHGTNENWRINVNLYVRDKNTLGFDLTDRFKNPEQLQIKNISTMQAKIMIKRLEDYINLRES